MEFTNTVVLYLTLLLTTAAISASSATVKDLCHPDDKKTLLAIKQSFNNSYLFASWSSTTDCCSWYMVKCDRTTHRIISLTVFAYPLAGTLPSLIGDLTYLQTLRFHKLTNLTGDIPSSIVNLQSLVSADFSWNQLSGPIPSFFSAIKTLQFLDLSSNQFSGSIPPELSLAPNLFSLRLDRNRLTGPIPNTFGSFIQRSNLYLILSHNQLSGQIPTSLGDLNFSQIDFSRNQLTGDASFLFGKTKSVLIMDLSRNQLSFDFTNVEMPSALTSLDLNHNKLFGSLPSTGMENLQFFNVSYNRLCGPIPNEGQLQTFDQSSYIHNKCLCGAPLSACNSSSTLS